MISRRWNVPIPLLIDDEYLRDDGSEGTQPTDVPSRMGVFVYSSKLFELLAEILESFYMDESGAPLTKPAEVERPDKDLIARTLEFNRRLEKFADSIPEYLRTAEISQIIVSDRNSYISLQQQVLYCRYEGLSFDEHPPYSLTRSRFLYVRVLTLRPLLLIATRRGRLTTQRILARVNEPSLDQELIERCCNLCVLTAHRLIEIIHQHLDTAYKSTGWHSVYCKSSPLPSHRFMG